MTNYSLKVREMAKESDNSLFINFFFNSLKKSEYSLIFRPSLFTIHYFFGSLFTIHYKKGPLFTNHYTPSRPSWRKFDTSPVSQFKEVGNLSLVTFCHMKRLTPISKSLHFQCVKFILIGQMFYVLITNEHSLTYIQNYCFAFFFETWIKAAIQVLRF